MLAPKTIGLKAQGAKQKQKRALKPNSQSQWNLQKKLHHLHEHPSCMFSEEWLWWGAWTFCVFSTLYSPRPMQTMINLLILVRLRVTLLFSLLPYSELLQYEVLLYSPNLGLSRESFFALFNSLLFNGERNNPVYWYPNVRWRESQVLWSS